MKTTITTTSINSSWISSPPNPKTFLPERFLDPSSIKFQRAALESTTRSSPLIVKCNKNGSPSSGNGGSLKDVLSGMVNEGVEQLLYKEENKDLLDGLEQASLRVEKAKRELAEIEKQEIESKIMRDYINQLESRASEIAECQKEIMEAKVMVEEAERFLTENGGEQTVSKDEERLESIKAATIAAIIGTLADLPICLARVSSSSNNSSQLTILLPLAITFVSCALFGVTFRYAVRKDLDNSQLKSGTSAAFGFVKGLGMLGGGAPLELEAGSIVSHAIDGGVYISESVLVFLFAGVALDFCIKLGSLSTFPIDRLSPRT